MNRGQMRTFASLLSSDPNLTRFTATQYNDIIDIANEQFATDSRSLFKYKEYTLVDATGAYTLPTDFMYERDVELQGEDLLPKSRYTMNRSFDSNWKDDKGTPTHYIVDPEVGRKQILLYPIPEAKDVGKTVTMAYYVLPAVMTADADIPLNSSSYHVRFHMGIVAFAVWSLMNYEVPTPETDAKMSKM